MTALPEKVAIVHDWLNGMRGGEKVLEELFRLWPLAEAHTLFYEPHRLSPLLNSHPIHPSPLQRLPRTRRHYRQMLPFFPWAVNRMDFGEAELLLSVSHCAAKGARSAQAPHLCYCLSPARYLYDQGDRYFSEDRGWKKSLRQALLRRFREWDQATAQNVDHFIAISRFVARRIQKAYGREAQVLYPPVDTEIYTPGKCKREDFYLTVCAAVPYKKLDVILEAFNRCRKPLVVVGRGPELPRLKALAQANIRFEPWLGHRALRDLYRWARGFVFMAEEDFGITPLEAQACGCPVLAYGQGGLAETIPHQKTGLLFPAQQADALLEALDGFEKIEWDDAAIRANAERFGAERFRREFQVATADFLARRASLKPVSNLSSE